MRWYHIAAYTLAVCITTCGGAQTFTVEQPKTKTSTKTKKSSVAPRPEARVKIAEENAAPSASAAKRPVHHHAKAAKTTKKLAPPPVAPVEPEVTAVAPVHKPAPPPLQPVPSLTNVSNSELQKQIESSLHGLPSSNGLRVNVTETTITLAGTVANGKEKLEATRLAQSYSGNRLFKDEIQIAGSQRVTAIQPVNSNAGVPSTVGNSFTPPKL